MPRNKDEKPTFKLGRVTGKPCYYVTWSESGRSKRVSTGTDDETAAKQYLADCVAAWNAPPEKSEQTVNMAIDAYLKFKKGEYLLKGQGVTGCKSNYRTLEITLIHIRSFFGSLKINQLNRQLGRDYVNHRRKVGVKRIDKNGKEKKSPVSNATIAKQLSILNAALNHIRREGWIGEVPVMQLPPPPPPKDKWMNQDQVRTFVNALKTPHIKLFALLALHTLSRKTAVLQLKWSQVDMENRLIDYNVPGRVRTNKRRVPVPINNILFAALQEALELGQTDYVIEFRGEPLLDIKKAFARVASSKEVDMPWVTPHILRHTGATLMAQQGVPLWQIAGIMGDNLNTVMKHYAKHHPDYLKEAVNKLDEMYG